jgi:hypothetical protein
MNGMQPNPPPKDEAGPLWLIFEAVLDSVPSWGPIALFGILILIFVVTVVILTRSKRGG